MQVQFHDGVTIEAKDGLVLARLSKKVAGGAQIGIMTQDEDAREYAEEIGINVIETVADHASGNKAMWDRPNAKPWVTQPQLMARYQAVIVSDFTRLSREGWADEAKVRQWAETNHKLIRIVNKDLRWPPRFDSHYDDDVSAWNRAPEDAHREWAATSRRYKRMHKGLQSEGFTTNRPIYGYRSYGANCGKTPCRCYEHKIDDHKVTKPYPPEVPVVLEIVRLYLEEGWGVERIADYLDAQHIPSPMWRGKPGKHWVFKTIADLLRSPSIAGHRYPRDENDSPDTTRPPIETYEGIIDWDTHLRLVARLDSRANRKGISPANAYMLTGMITDEKGHRMWGIKGGNRNKWYYYYCRKPGCGFMARIDQVDAEVSEAVEFRYGHTLDRTWHTIPSLSNANQIALLRQERNELIDAEDGYLDRVRDFTSRIRELADEDKHHPKTDKIRQCYIDAETGEAVPIEDASPDGHYRTVADSWKALNTVAAKRDWLKAHSFKVIAVPIPDERNWDVVGNEQRTWQLFIDSGLLLA